MPTVVDCLDELNTTTFKSLISSAPDLLQTLTSVDSRVTVFAPTNEAIEGQHSSLVIESYIEVKLCYAYCSVLFLS